MRQLTSLKYKHLSDEQRHTIATLRAEGSGTSQIARALGRHRSTIYRETTRNVSTHDGFYRYSAAGELYRGRLRRSRRNRQYGPSDFTVVEQLLRASFSPEQIVGRAKLEGYSVMSHETIYLWVWADRSAGGDLWRHLRGASKLKRKRYGNNDSRGRLAGKKMTSDRPAIVDRRSRFGDWEIDTVHGRGKASLVTAVERKSGLVRIGKLPRATAEHTLERTVQLLQAELHRVHTITADNGSEFHCYKRIEAQLRTQVYFATPHHAWERGTNENTNGLIRQFVPKRTNLRNFTQDQCDSLARSLNHRPRLRLGFKSPSEVYYNISVPWFASCGKL